MRSIYHLSILALILFIYPVTAGLYAQEAFQECSETEAWVPVHDGFTYSALAATEMNNKLYVVHRGQDTGEYVLSRLEREGWTEVSVFRAYGSNNTTGPISELIAYSGELYISGAFATVNDLPRTSGLAKWDGAAWKAVPGIDAINTSHPISPFGDQRCFAMTIYKGELYLSGAFKDESGEVYLGIVAGNGAQWRTIARTTPMTDSMYVTSFAEWRGALYVGGHFSRVEGINARGVARWDGASWSALGVNDRRATLKLLVFKDRLYAIRDKAFSAIAAGDEHVARWDGTSWEEMPGILPKLRSFEMNIATELSAEVYHENIYLIAMRRVENTITNNERVQWVSTRWDGTRRHHLARPSMSMSFLKAHDAGLYMGGAFSYICGAQVNYVAQLCDERNCVGISGRVFNDPAGDCVDDPTKRGIPGTIIQVGPWTRHVMTDDDGRYHFMIHPGTYTLRAAPPLYHDLICPSDSVRTVTVAASGDRVTGVDFGVRERPGVRDLDLRIHATAMRPGRGFRYYIYCTNRGTTFVPLARLELHFDPMLTYISSHPESARLEPGSVEWNVTNLKPGEGRGFEVWCKVPDTTHAGTIICAKAGVSDEDDLEPKGNHQELCALVTNSFDPNDMSVTPRGVWGTGQLMPGDTLLSYMIRFENTGNDTAFRVVVVDTLSTHLDLMSLRLGPTSHPFKLRFGGRERALIWVFDDINLPDTGRSKERSQGYITYSVRFMPGLPTTTPISNRAGIYFDYNAPIMTNTVTIRTPYSIPASAPFIESDASDLVIYPNPTHGALHLRGALRKGSLIRVQSLLGETVRVQRVDEGDEESAIDLSDLPAGRYLIVLEGARGTVARQVTLLR